MQTDVNVSEIIKQERRKVFGAMNTLPWVIVFLLLSGIAFYFYRQSLNVNKPVPAPIVVAPVAPVIPVAPVVPVAPVAPVEVKKSIVEVEPPIKTNMPPQSAIDIVTQIRKELRTELEREYASKEDKRMREWEKLKKIAYDNALYNFQVSAVSNSVAEWSFNVKGERSFKWLQAGPSTRGSQFTLMDDPELMHLMPNREVPFSLEDYALAKNISINIEAEVLKASLATVEANFVGKTRNDERILKKKIESDLIVAVKNVFDGFETYSKENRRK